MILKALSVVKSEIRDIKEKYLRNNINNETQSFDSLEKSNSDLLHCRMENTDLKTKIKIQDEYVRRLEEERASLVTTINLLMRDQSASVAENLPIEREIQRVNNDEDKNKKNKKKKSNKDKQTIHTADKGKVQQDKSQDDENSISTETGVGPNDENRTNTLIMGDSIISKLAGWKMSHKSNRTTIRSFPGSRVEDMADYVKPTLKWKPHNIILHTGTNNLRTDEPLDVAEKIVKICEQIEQRSPKTIVAISELTARHDSIELDQKRKEFNSAFFKDSSVVGQNYQRAHFPCPPPRIVCDRRRCEPSTTGTS